MPLKAEGLAEAPDGDGVVQEGAGRQPFFSAPFPLAGRDQQPHLRFARPSHLPLVLFSLASLVGARLGVEVRGPRHVPSEGRVAAGAAGTAAENFAGAAQSRSVCSGGSWRFICTKARPAFRLSASVTLLLRTGRLDSTAEVGTDRSGSLPFPSISSFFSALFNWPCLSRGLPFRSKIPGDVPGGEHSGHEKTQAFLHLSLKS